MPRPSSTSILGEEKSAIIVAIDSAVPPSAASIIAAKNAGVKLWAGYFAGTDILRGWSQNDFTRIKESGLATMAYCSGWANPATMKAQAASWGVPICLDVEGGIRGDGPWVQGWLDRSRTPPDPHAVWPSWRARPSGPCGWQWYGSHANFGAEIDTCWFDDFFMSLRFTFGSGSLGGDKEVLDANDPIVKQILAALYSDKPGPGPTPLVNIVNNVTDVKLDQLLTKLNQLAVAGGGSVDLTPVLAALTELKTELAKLDALGQHLGLGTP